VTARMNVSIALPTTLADLEETLRAARGRGFGDLAVVGYQLFGGGLIISEPATEENAR
jgi:hypothetical protein